MQSTPNQNPQRYEYDIELCEFLISPNHAYFSRTADEGPAETETVRPDSIELIANRGIVGDRFFDTAPLYRADEFFDGQVTFVSAEVLELAARSFPAATSTVLRRNIVIRGVNLQALIGEHFSIVTDTAHIEFYGTKTCSPCRWLERAGEAGLLAFFRGRGGLRTRVSTSGELTLGPGKLTCDVENLHEHVDERAARPNLP